MPPRSIEALVPPGVALLAVLLLAGAARILSVTPASLPECGLLARTSIPCPACGGTRSMEALSKGRIGKAFQYNPAAVAGTAAIGLWFLRGLHRYRRGWTPPAAGQRRKRAWIVAISITVLIAGNWLYLILRFA